MENIEEIPMDLTSDETREKANDLLSQMQALVLTIRNLKTNGATHKEVNDVREKFAKAYFYYERISKKRKRRRKINKYEKI